LPIIQLSPYDIPCGPVRDDWMEMYNRDKELQRVVYWYGVDKEFSFVNGNEIMTYEEGVKKGYHILPDRIKKVMGSNKKISGDDLLLRDGLLEQAGELKLPKEKRVAWLKTKEDFKYLDGIVESSDKESHEELQNLKIETKHENEEERSMKGTQTATETETTGATSQMKKERKEVIPDKVTEKKVLDNFDYKELGKSGVLKIILYKHRMRLKSK